MSIKFNYTSGLEFTLNGIPYIGYFNVDESGNAYTGKIQDGNSKLLNSFGSKLSIDYDRSNYFKDRLVYDVLTLPNSLDKILIAPNELVNFSSINTKMRYLHNNLLYIYSKMFFADTDVPVEYDKTLANYVNSNNEYIFNWSNNYSLTKKSLFANPQYSGMFNEFDNIKRFIMIPFNDGSGISMLGISDTHIVGLTSNYMSDGSLNGVDFVLYTNYIDNSTLETYKKLEDITYDGHYLYVTDSQINSGGQVFKYDINSFFTNNPIFDFKKFLIEPIGGIGGYDRYNKFKNCTTLGCKSDELWVFDSGNNCIKIYDGNFVFKKTLKVHDYKILDIRYRKLDDSMCLLYERASAFGLLKYDSDLNLTKFQFEDELDNNSDLRFYRMAVSEQDSNVFYLTTDNSVFKKFFTKPASTFATFSREKYYINTDFVFDTTDCVFGDERFLYTYDYGKYYNFDQKINDIFILGYDNKNYDDLFLIGNSFITHIKEKTNYESLLKDNYLNYYDYNSISLDKNEYVQSFVLNKEIYKIYSDLILLKNNLRGKFLYEFDRYGDLNKIDIMYLTDEEINLLNVDIEFDSFINDNELLNPNVINRVFGKIYKLQSLLLDVTNVRIKNLKTAINFDGSNILNIS